jgi:hypothetical protein
MRFRGRLLGLDRIFRGCGLNRGTVPCSNAGFRRSSCVLQGCSSFAQRTLSKFTLAPIIQSTRCNILMYNEIRCFFRICQLLSRHAVTSCYIIRYGVFSGRADYSVDMRNIFDSLALWQIQYSDYSVDMRKSIPEQEMWPSDFFAPRGGACARLARDVFAIGGGPSPKQMRSRSLVESLVWLA